AFAYLQKPADPASLEAAFDRIAEFVDRPVRKLLVVDDDERQRTSIIELVGGDDVSASTAGSGADALAALKAERFDCVVIDLGLPDMTGVELVEAIKRDAGIRQVPIIVYTGRELDSKQRAELARMAEAVVIKDVSSPDLLFAEVSLHLHRQV